MLSPPAKPRFVLFLTTAAITLLFASTLNYLYNKSNGSNFFSPTSLLNFKHSMQISSSAFANNQPIPPQYTCDGQDINPPLSFQQIPAETESLVLIVDDPDAPRGDWVHWLVWNIDPKITQIHENSLPMGAMTGMTDFGQSSWGGPCPPSGLHRYHFKLYALDARLNLASGTNRATLEKAMQGHILDQAVLVGTYSRKLPLT